MIALLQRVSSASVTINTKLTAAIGSGLLVFLGVQKADSLDQVADLARRICSYRIFPDDRDRMNLDVRETSGSVLLVPQFTLAADTSSGRRPGFSTAAAPEVATDLFDRFCDLVALEVSDTQRGTFGADMQVALVNDGPVTFWLTSDSKG